MKKILLIIVCLTFICSANVFGQGGVVSAPILEAQVGTLNATQASQTSIMTGMNGVIAALEKADKVYKEAMTKATWLRNLQTAQRLLFMIENLVCTSKNLSQRMSIGGSSCFYSMKYDMMFVKVQMSADYLGIVLSGVSMTSGERMRTLDDVLVKFEESQKMMLELNKQLNSDMMRLRVANSSKTTLSSLYALNRAKSRRK